MALGVLLFVGSSTVCGCHSEALGAGGGDADLVDGSVAAAPDLSRAKAAATTCSVNKDERSCIASGACVAVYLCGEPEFRGCMDADAQVPRFGPFCYVTRCSSHGDEAACAADTSCHVEYTPGPNPTFAQCLRNAGGE